MKKVEIEMDEKLYNSLKWLSTQKDSKGISHSISEITITALNLFLMSIQIHSKNIKKMN